MQVTFRRSKAAKIEPKQVASFSIKRLLVSGILGKSTDMYTITKKKK